VDRDYYRRRLGQEQSAAKSATCDTARSVHRTLAELYAQMLQADAGVAGSASIVPLGVPLKLRG
jgi:hypothetical protein